MRDRLEYCWLSTRPLPPQEWDLRDYGWQLQPEIGNWVEEQPSDWPKLWARLRQQDASAYVPLLIDMRSHGRPPLPGNRDIRQRALLLGVERSSERAHWLEGGFGDVGPMRISKHELAARLTRITLHSDCVANRRNIGTLALDLFHRDARKDGRWLALHPREFALLWRLAEMNGGRLSREALLADIWRVEHDPGTNRVEVHVSRLRQKLAMVGCRGLIVTDPEGGYRLAIDFAEPVSLRNANDSIAR